MAHIRKLWQQVSPNEDLSNIGFHGGGSRYFDNTKLAEKCIQYLPRVIFGFPILRIQLILDLT